MKTYILVYFICAAFILSGCVSNSSPDEPLPTLSNTLEKNVGSINIEEYISEKPELKDTVLTAEIKISPLTEKVSDAVLPNVSLNNEALKSERSQILEKKINEEIERQLLLNPELPSLLTAAEIYEQTTIQLFTGLSEATGGETFMIDNADYVVRIIKEIIKNYLTDKTDFVFMVDRTTSMDDDIDAIKESINKIINALENFKDVKVGFTFYADKNTDGGRWFKMHKLDKDLNVAKHIINTTFTYGGGFDLPESVNDAIVKTIDEMNWTTGRRRMILLIGDAPSLEPPLSTYTLSQVIGRAVNAEVTMNFYPVIIGLQQDINGIFKKEDPFSLADNINITIAPNPATNYTLIKTDVIADYKLEVFNIHGGLIYSKEFTDNNISILTDAYSTGVYITRLINTTTKESATQKFVVKH
ncbi:MAG: T9SS type A sorting domain-containing protein [Bacteroidetes bacterium]|jgi:hypothetical protein|nr:T9SS type A sorting domain-containing protein [Bacteroidota bacterium]MBP8916417.1 T9SS type A sorting domain-containing protein [Chitinophagales bacterium]MBP9795854.1 T9SS type A sorting domain-containing protein [Chitinophagales bacterium]